MKTIVCLIYLLLCFCSSSIAKLTEQMQFLKGPEDGYIYSYDYNPVCGISAALVVSEYDNSKNWVPTRTTLLVKKDGDSIWTVGMKDMRSDAVVQVFDNGVIGARAKFKAWVDNKYEDDEWIAFTTDMGLNWTKSEATFACQTILSKGTTIYSLWNDFLHLSFDLGKNWYWNELPNINRYYHNYINFDFLAVSDSGMTYVQSKHSYCNSYHPDTVYFLKSKDNIIWEDVGYNLRLPLISMLFKNENNFFAITDSSNGFIYSNDQGKTITRSYSINQQLKYIKFTDNSRSQIFATNDTAAFIINTDNLTTKQIPVPGGKIVGISAKNNILYATSQPLGIYTSSDFGANWQWQDKPGNPLAYYDFKIDKNDIMYIVCKGFYPANSFRLYRSKDYSKSWELMMESQNFLGLQKIHGKVFLEKYDEAKLFMLDPDPKLSFDFVNNGTSSLFYRKITQFGDNSILFNIYNEVTSGYNYYISNDGGISWNQTDKPTKSVFDSYYIKNNNEMYYTDGADFILYDKNLNIRNQYKTDFLKITEKRGDPKNGFTYYDRPSKAYLFKDGKSNAVIFEGDGSSVETKYNIFVSVDNGNTWGSRIFPVYLYINSPYFIQTPNDDIYYSYLSGLYKFNSDSLKLYKIANYPSKTWIHDTTIDADVYINQSIQYDSKGGIWTSLKYLGLSYYYSGSSFDGGEDSTGSIALNQILVYPNPVTNETNVWFRVNRDKSITTIKVYDYLGREALDAYLDLLSAGEYKQKINLSELPNGLYFVVVNAGGDVSASAIHLHR